MRTSLLAVAAVLVLGALASGCGGSDDDGQQAATTATATAAATDTPAASAGRSLTIRMADYSFDPKDAVAEAGNVTISAPNEGQLVHELVLLKTDADPAQLPKKGDEVDESTSVGEIADVEPGSTKSASFKLAKGKYAMVCALPGHYEAGMYGSLTVK